MPAGASWFEKLEEAPPDPILGTALAYKADTNPNKVDLGIGAYRDETGKPVVLPVVREVERQIAADEALNKEYLPIDGWAPLKKLTQQLLLGEDPSIDLSRICSLQALSGTGALRVGFEFLKTVGMEICYVSDPTWGNHKDILKKSGIECRTYPYWDPASRSLDFKGMTETLRAAPEGSVVLLHSCAHNPTGVDPTEAQWGEILSIVQEKKLFPFFDNAYQGYASGDLEKDGAAVRMFEKAGLEMICAQSFAKNFGLYGERIGMLHLFCANFERAKVVLSRIKLVVRPMYSSPPRHGAMLVSRILEDPALKKRWETELKEIAGRILKVRSLLRKALEERKTPGTWEHITNQIGMFSFTGLTVAQSERMTQKHHVYMLKSGRISLAGLNDNNIGYVADAIYEVLTSEGAKL